MNTFLIAVSVGLNVGAWMLAIVYAMTWNLQVGVGALLAIAIANQIQEEVG